MAEEGGFELLRAYVTTLVSKTSFDRTMRQLGAIRQMAYTLEKPVRMELVSPAAVDTAVQKTRELKKEVDKLRSTRAVISPKVNQAAVSREINGLINKVNERLRNLDLLPADKRTQLGRTLRWIRNQWLYGMKQSTDDWWEHLKSRLRGALSGPVIKMDPEMRNFLRQVSKANKGATPALVRTDAEEKGLKDFARIAKNLDRAILAEKKKSSDRSVRLKQLEARKIVSQIRQEFAERQAKMREAEALYKQLMQSAKQLSREQEKQRKLDAAKERARRREQLKEAKAFTREIAREQLRTATAEASTRRRVALSAALRTDRSLAAVQTDINYSAAIAAYKNYINEARAQVKLLAQDKDEAAQQEADRLRENIAMMRRYVRALQSLQAGKSINATGLPKGSAASTIQAEKDAAAERQRIALSMARQDKERKRRELSVAQTHYSKYAETVSKGLFEIRRNLHGFGAFSAVLSARLTRDTFKFKDLNAKLREAFRTGDMKAIRAAGVEMARFSEKIQRTATILARLQVAMAFARRALAVFKAALAPVGALLSKLGSAVVNLGKRMVSIPFKALRLGIVSLLGPTLMVVSAFKRLATYLPLIFSYGLASWVRSAVDSFSDFQRVIATGAGQLGLFADAGSDAIKTLSLGARQVAREWLVTQEDLAVGIEELARGGIAAGIGDARQQVAVVVQQLRNAAAIRLATGVDMGEAAKILTVIKAQWGTIGREADDVVDLVLKAQSLAPILATDVRKFYEAAGAAARNAGNDAIEAIASGIKLMQNVPSGARAGTAYSRGLILLAKPAKEARKTLQELRIDMNRFLDDSKQRFLPGGSTLFFEEMTAAAAGLVDQISLFGFRARDMANLLNVDPRGLTETQQSIRDINEQLQEAMRNNFAQRFAELIRDRTIFGSLQSLRIELNELKLAFTETFIITITRVVTGIRDLVAALSGWLRTSGAAQTMQLALLRTFTKIRDTVLPLINAFAKLSAVINATLIAAIPEIVSIVASKLLPSLRRMQDSISKAIGLPEGALDSWYNVGQTIAYVFQNIEQIVGLAIANVKIRLADLGAAILEAISPGSQAGAALQDSIESVLSTAVEVSKRVGIASGKMLVAGFKLGFHELGPAIIETFGHALPLGPVGNWLAKKAGIPIDEMRSWAADLVAGNGNALAEFTENVRDITGEMVSGLNASLDEAFNQDYGNALDGARKQLESMRTEAERAASSIRSSFQGVLPDLEDQLAAASEAYAELDRRVSQQSRKLEGDSTITIKSEIGDMREFQRMLQQGDVQRSMLDEMRSGNSISGQILGTLNQILQGTKGGNPNAVGGGAAGSIGR